MENTTNSDFIDAFRKSPYSSLIQKENQPYLIFIGGSRANKLADSHSDFDLVGLIPEQSKKVISKCYLRYKGIKVHWYYSSIDDLIINNSSDGAMQGYANDNLEIWRNPDYNGAIDYFYSNSRDIAKCASCNFLLNDKSQEFLKRISGGTINFDDRHKILYHFAYASYLILEEDPDVDFLISLKKIQDIGILDADARKFGDLVSRGIQKAEDGKSYYSDLGNILISTLHKKENI
jgi:hypothetical protein